MLAELGMHLARLPVIASFVSSLVRKCSYLQNTTCAARQEHRILKNQLFKKSEFETRVVSVFLRMRLYFLQSYRREIENISCIHYILITQYYGTNARDRAKNVLITETRHALLAPGISYFRSPLLDYILN